MTREQALREAVRVRPNKAAIKELREVLAAYQCSDEKDDILVAGGLGLLLEMNDKINAAMGLD